MTHLERFMTNKSTQFWLLQFIGWSGLSIVSFFSLNLWYNQPDMSYVAHNILQSVAGAVISWPLRSIYTRLWPQAWSRRTIKVVVAVLLAALVWSTVRLLAFMLMTGERGLWADFGGWYFPSIFIFLCWTTLYHGVKYYQQLQDEHAQLLELEAKQRRESMRLLEAEATAKEAQLKMLRYQLNPHFLFNTLNALSSLISSGANQRANAMLVKLSQFLRYSLDRNHDLLVELSDELDATRLYLAIEQERFSDRLQTHFDIDPELTETLVPSLILQPLVENSIKYAIAPSEDGGSITIRAQRLGSHLQLEVEDSGYGFVNSEAIQEGMQEGMGVGLNNTRQRLETLFGDAANLTIVGIEDGAGRVLIRIPLPKDAAS